jgi:hypothetical protein
VIEVGNGERVKNQGVCEGLEFQIQEVQTTFIYHGVREGMRKRIQDYVQACEVSKK